MTVDTVVDLRQRAGELAQRLGSLGHFPSAAHELLDIIRHLSSEILLRHSRKIVTLVEISRATLSRAGLKLHLFTSCAPTLRNHKTLYFDILRALRERQEVIVNGDNLKDRVSRLLMPLSTWLVIHRKDSPSMVPSSVPVSPNVDSTTPSPPPEASQVRTTPVNRLSATAQPVPAPEELMPPPPSLPHRFQHSPSTSPRGRSLILQPDPNQRSGVIRMARTRSPRPVLLEEPGLMELPTEPAASPIVVPRRTQRFGIFCTGASGSGARRRALTVPRSGP